MKGGNKVSLNETKKLEQLKELANITFEELQDMESKRYWDRSYLVKPWEIIEAHRKYRRHNKPDFPYISYKGMEIVKMAYALKVMTRANTVGPLFEMPDRTEHIQTTLSLKTVKDAVNKGYLRGYNEPVPMERSYTLGEEGFKFLDKPVYITDFTQREMGQYRRINGVLDKLCQEFRGTYVMEWATQPEFMDAYQSSAHQTTATCIFWDDVQKRAASEASVFVLLTTNFPQEQKEEIQDIQENYERSLENGDLARYFPVTPSVYVVDKDAHKDTTLKVVDRGRPWAGEGQIQDWVAL